VGLKTSWESLSSIFFFRNYLPADLGGRATGHLWSLAIEEHFYLIWPALLIWLGRKGATGAAWLSIGFALWRVADANNHWTEALLSVPVHYRTDLRLDSLLWGAVAAFVLHDSPAALRKKKELLFYLGLVAATACVILYSHLTGIWLPMLIPALLAGTVSNPQWAASRVLENPLLVRIGKISYSLYLWQEIFLTPGWEHKSVLQTAPWNVLATFACAFASYRLIEKPCMDFGRTLAARWRGSLHAPVQTLAEVRGES
jgi:peptidoglycan/LPS O-acetylase OafA/YrhL